MPKPARPAKRSKHSKAIAAVAKQLARAKPERRWALLYEAALLFGVAGARTQVSQMIALVLGAEPPLPPPTPMPSVVGEGPLHGLARALGEPELLTLRPVQPDWEAYVLRHLTHDQWSHLAPPDGDPTQLAALPRWRRVIALAYADPEAALAALRAMLDAPPDVPPFVWKNALLLGSHLAVRAGDSASARRWLAAAKDVAEDRLWLALAFCLPTLAKLLLVDGALAAPLALGADDAARLADEVHTAVSAPAPAPAKPGTPQKLAIDVLYNQIHLEHAGAEPGEPFFQDPADHARGYSLQPRGVAIATPSETGACTVEVRVLPSPHDPSETEGAVVVPITVTGPLVILSVAGEPEDLQVPPGRYDLVARFGKPKTDRKTKLRTFPLSLDFVPPRSATG